MTDRTIGRRHFLRKLSIGAGGALLSGCDALNESEGFRDILFGAEKLHQAAQRTMIGRNALAREFSPEDMSPKFRANGNRTAASPLYKDWLASGFEGWRLSVGGMVGCPLSLKLADLMAMPQRSQITRHDCVEGWSAIGQWQGPRLSHVLRLADLSSRARYIVFRCADDFRSTHYYESIDMVDALHPQTILAWQMNGDMLPEAHGAPLRLRVERQLGYKHAKFLVGIDAVDRLDDIGGGRGGYWEDRGDYNWYAGI